MADLALQTTWLRLSTMASNGEGSKMLSPKALRISKMEQLMAVLDEGTN